MKKVFIALAIVCLVVQAISGRVANAESVPAGVDHVKSSLGLVIGYNGDGLRIGSSFCVYSDSDRSLFVTNRHVIHGVSGIVVVRQFPDQERLQARVVAVGTGNKDVALLEVSKGDIPVVTMSTDSGHIGEEVATIGYPTSTVLFKGNEEEKIRPTYSVGTIHSYANDGFYIDLFMSILHGNSGGPLFDVQTQRVVGIITAGTTDGSDRGEAIPASQILLLASSVGYERVGHTTATVVPNTDRAKNGNCPSDIVELDRTYRRWYRAYQEYVTEVQQIGSELSRLSGSHDGNSIARQETLVNDQVTLTNEISKTYETIFVDLLEHIERNDSTPSARASYALVDSVHRADSENAAWVAQIQQSIYIAASGKVPPALDHRHVDNANRDVEESRNFESSVRPYVQCVVIDGDN